MWHSKERFSCVCLMVRALRFERRICIPCVLEVSGSFEPDLVLIEL